MGANHRGPVALAGGEPVRVAEGARAVWSPDGGHLAFVSRRSGSARVWIARADGSSLEEVEDSVFGQSDLVWLPDGRLAWPTPDRRNYRIRDLQTGRNESLKLNEAFGGSVSDATFSPRGDQAAFVQEWPGTDALLLMSWPQRTERRLARQVRPIGWSVDGEWIYAIEHGRRAVVRVSTQTGRIEEVRRFPRGLQVVDCDLIPDETAIVCSIFDQKGDAWLMNDFDPGVSVSRH